jgi:hypothetical protein
MVLATEPIDKKNKDILRPRLSRLEVQVISSSLTLLTNRLNGTKDEKTSAWVEGLNKRFQRLAEGSKFLRPRRKKGR